jgi:Na+/H+ antiporter NhaA
MASLAGIGFTVALLVTELAIDDEVLASQARLGVLAGSIVSAAIGLAILLSDQSTKPKILEEANEPSV